MKTLDQIDFKRIIIVAYRLPFKLVRKKQKNYAVQNAGGLVSAILSLSEKMMRENSSAHKIIWVGTGVLQLGDSATILSGLSSIIFRRVQYMTTATLMHIVPLIRCSLKNSGT